MNPKDVKEIIKAVELLRKSGSLDKFIENVEIDYSDKGLDHPFTTEGYDSIKLTKDEIEKIKKLIRKIEVLTKEPDEREGPYRVIEL